MDKQCSKCKEVKDIQEFGNCNANTDRLNSRCKLCQRAANMVIKNRKRLEKQLKLEKLLIENPNFLQDKKDQKKREKLLSLKTKYRAKHPAQILLGSAKQRARKYNLEFNITLTDIIIPKICPVLEIPILTGKLSSNSPSVDRIDSTKGYTKENIKVISFLANTMKNNATKEQLEIFSKNILEYIK